MNLLNCFLPLELFAILRSLLTDKDYLEGRFSSICGKSNVTDDMIQSLDHPASSKILSNYNDIQNDDHDA